MRFSSVSLFVTLTYETSNLVFADDEPCLCKSDLQKHFKRLRKRLEPHTVKYYAVGEYGDRSTPGRPHYHYLLFYRGQKDRFKLVQLVKDSWQLGMSMVLPVQGAQGYVTKYILKFDKRDHLVKPFSMISHGLGIDYLSEAILAFHRKGLINFATKPGGFRQKLPRYYMDRIFSEYQRLLIKKRSDMQRRDVELIRLSNYDNLLDIGVNPFKEKVELYRQTLRNSLNHYRNKKKL